MTSVEDSESSLEQLRQAKIASLLARYGAASPTPSRARARSRPRHHLPPLPAAGIGSAVPCLPEIVRSMQSGLTRGKPDLRPYGCPLAQVSGGRREDFRPDPASVLSGPDV